jgi:hypothetical protein
MKTFQQFLTENFTPAMFSHVKTRQEGRIVRLCALLTQYATGDVPNPIFNDIKDLANRIVDESTSSYDVNDAMHTRFVNMVPNAFQQFDSSQYSPSYTNQVAGKLKLAEKNRVSTKIEVEKEYLDWLLPVLRELNIIAVAVEDMKGRAVKRQPKAKEDAHEKYVTPLASKESGKLVIDALTKMTASMYDEFAKSVSNWMIGEAERLAKLDVKAQDASRHELLQYGSHLFEAPDRWTAKTLVKNYKKICIDKGIEAADFMQKQFVIKNAQKLASIMDAKKAKLASAPEVLYARVAQRGTFEGDMRLTFVDGSHFEVRNQVVFKVNSYGTFFMQYPTTFHNVVMPNGKPMGQPSEERMNTVFATA